MYMEHSVDDLETLIGIIGEPKLKIQNKVINPIDQL